MSTKNLVDDVWGEDRPKRPQNPVFLLDETYTGEHSTSKFKRVAETLGDSADFLLVTTLDDIAWILNCRGTDIDFNPVFFSYLLFNPKELSATLYIDEVKTKDI